MSEVNNEFEQLLEETLVTIHNGEIVEGTVISVKEDEIVLNIMAFHTKVKSSG